MKKYIAFVLERVKLLLNALYSFAKENWGLLVPLLGGAVILLFHRYIAMRCGLNKSLFNPWIQSMPFVLLMYSVGWVLPNWAGRLYFSFLILLSTFLTCISNFLQCVFKIPMTSDVYFVLAATSVQESIEFVRIYFNWKIWLIVISVFSFLTAMLYLVWRGPIKRSKVTAVIAFVLMIPYLINVIRFSAKGEYEPLYKRNLEFEMSIAFFEYRDNLKSLVAMVKMPKLPRNISRIYREKMVGVLVVGESASRDHWGLYGYYRNTTPEMERIRKDILIYDDAVSVIANTCGSTRMMFSTAEFPSQLPLDYTAFSVLKAAGYKVFCISNQFRLGAFDGPVNILYSGIDRKEFMQEQHPGAQDGIVLERLQKYLTETDGPVLVIVHLIGSHADYAERFPAEFDKFTGRNRFQTEFSDYILKDVNNYDNSILYTDHILGKIVKMVQEMQVPGYMLYVSDHGECAEVPGSRSVFSTFYSCYEVPMIFYGNERYKKCFPDFMKAASGNTGKSYMTDWLNYSIVSTAQVTHDGFPAEKDIFSAKYKERKKRYVGLNNMPYRNPRVKKPFSVDKYGVVKHLEKTAEAE